MDLNFAAGMKFESLNSPYGSTVSVTPGNSWTYVDGTSTSSPWPSSGTSNVPYTGTALTKEQIRKAIDTLKSVDIRDLEKRPLQPRDIFDGDGINY